MPAPLPEFQPHPLLRSGHAMTIAAVFVPRKFQLPPAEDRYFQVDAESRILAHCHWQKGKRCDAPVIVIVHGLEGSSDSNYVQGIAEKAYTAGFHAIRVNQRNCGGTEMLTPTLYNSGMSGDYRAVFEELADRDGYQHIFFAGYSMGGNLVSKLAGEYAGAAPQQLRGVCAICPALDLAACADALERWDNYLYTRHFVAGLLTRYRRKLQLFPKLYPQNGLGAIRTVWQFDDAITAPHFGFRDAQEYYESAGAKKLLQQICVPFLLITAQDDPFVPFASFAAAKVEQNAAICFLAPRHGGHCAFISARSGAERFWAEQRVVEFCRAILRGEN
jgi:uncharacterized protein